jgi:septal ring factor EnvC (AmiA/AmiB activator)
MLLAGPRTAAWLGFPVLLLCLATAAPALAQTAPQPTAPQPTAPQAKATQAKAKLAATKKPLPKAPASKAPATTWKQRLAAAKQKQLLDQQKQAAANELKQAERARAAKIAAAANAEHKETQAAARVATLAEQRVDAAAHLREIEAQVDAAAQDLNEATTAQEAADEAVQQRATDLSAMLPMALRMSEYPSETMLAAPVPPEKAVEGLLATKGLSAELARQVAELRAQQAEAARLKLEVGRKQAILATQRARQAEAARVLDRQIGAAHNAEQTAGEEGLEATQAAAVLAEKADDLRSAIAAMDQAERDAEAKAARDAALAQQRAAEQVAAAERQRRELAAEAARARALAAAHPGPSAADKAAHLAAVARAEKLAADQQAAAEKQKQILAASAEQARLAALSRTAGPGLSATVPKATLVAGRIVHAWGEATEDGTATGITYAAAPAAFVASPCMGRVGFAAPFRSYGKLMIIECGKGYDFVLAGMDRMDVPVGQSVRPGEPIGRMPDYDAAHATEKPGLYVELRRNGAPIDPMPYLNKKS